MSEQHAGTVNSQNPTTPNSSPSSVADEWRVGVSEMLDGMAKAHAKDPSATFGDVAQLVILDKFNKVSRVPTRYRFANIFELGPPPTPLYADAVDAMLSLFTPVRFSKRPPSEIIAMIGPRGTGKTHLACALVNLFLCCADGPHQTRRPLYRRASDMFTALKSTYSKKGGAEETQAEVIEQWAAAPLLVMDEIQVRSDTAWEDQTLTNIIDQRYGEMLPTVILSNLSLDPFLKSVGDSVASRLTESGQIIVANWPSYRLSAVA
jgi:DNA replication protein DnaC